MTASEIKGFINDGYLDDSVSDRYDPYYEPAFADDEGWRQIDDYSKNDLASYYDARRSW